MKQKLLIITFFLSSVCVAQSRSIQQVAEDYLKQYYSLNYSALPAYLTDSTSWIDPTTSVFNPNNKPIIGSANIIQNLKGSTNGVSEMKFETTESFSSGNMVVFIGWMSYKLATAKGVVPIRLKAITVLEIRNEKIVSQTDYADFDTFIKILRSK